jgi:hypothetical protein
VKSFKRIARNSTGKPDAATSDRIARICPRRRFIWQSTVMTAGAVLFLRFSSFATHTRWISEKAREFGFGSMAAIRR